MCFAYQIFHRLEICSLYKALHCCSAVGMPGTCWHTWARLRYSSPISGLLCLLHSESRGPIQGKIVRNEKRLASLGSVYKLDGLKFLRQTVADGVRISWYSAKGQAVASCAPGRPLPCASAERQMLGKLLSSLSL